MKMGKALIAKPGEKIEEIELDYDNFEFMQKCVGGYVQAVYPYEDPVAVLCNEDGKMNRLPVNRSMKQDDGTPFRDEAGNIYDVFVGTILIVGCGEEDFCPLTPELLKKYGAMYKLPEQLIKVNGILQTVPYEPDELGGL